MRYGKWFIHSRKRNDGGVPEYAADLYHEEGYDNIKDVAEGYCYFGPTHLGITLTLDDMEHRWAWHVGLPKVTFGLRGGKPRYPSREREYGWKYHHGTLWLLGGRNPEASSREDPWWWEVTVDLKRLVFGKIHYESRTLETHRGTIRMPEGDYPATVVLEESRWWSKRPLLGRFVSSTLRRAEVTPDTPIPEPGKGESGYDLDDDALHSLSTPAETVEEALERASEDVMDWRWQHGGLGWEPRKGWPVQHREGTPG